MDGGIAAIPNGNQQACADGKLEYVQIIHGRNVIKELAKINQTEMQILDQVVKSKSAITVKAK